VRHPRRHARVTEAANAVTLTAGTVAVDVPHFGWQLRAPSHWLARSRIPGPRAARRAGRRRMPAWPGMMTPAGSALHWRCRGLRHAPDIDPVHALLRVARTRQSTTTSRWRCCWRALGSQTSGRGADSAREQGHPRPCTGRPPGRFPQRCWRSGTRRRLWYRPSGDALPGRAAARAALPFYRRPKHVKGGVVPADCRAAVT
jgi:hypothetical protein